MSFVTAIFRAMGHACAEIYRPSFEIEYHTSNYHEIQKVRKHNQCHGRKGK